MSRYADFASASPRCQQILQTIELTSQQGIFIYDLTFLQQELEASLFAAVQRRDELQRSANGEVLTLPSTSFVRSANGKKPRDFKAERERRRKAFAGQMTRKRRRKKPKKPKEIRPAIVDETKLSNVEQFWLDVVEERRETFNEENLRSIGKLIDIDDEFLRHFHEEIPEKIRWKETIRSAKEYRHPELRHSLVVQQNEFFHERVKILRKKYSSLKTIERGKTNVSSTIDENVLAMLRRDDR